MRLKQGIRKVLSRVRGLGTVQLAVLAGIVLVVAGSATLVAARQTSDNAASVVDKKSAVQQQAQADDTPEEAAPVVAEKSAGQPASTETTPKPAATAQPGKKPATTPKPVAPPAPTYFTKKVTAPGQFKAGDMVYSIKGGNGYYAGDLVISPSTVYVGPGYEIPEFTVSTPDGKVVSVPTNPWDSKGPFYPAMTYSSGWASTFPMVLTGSAGPGMYPVHIQAGYTANDNDDVWTYHGWLTVIVE